MTTAILSEPQTTFGLVGDQIPHFNSDSPRKRRKSPSGDIDCGWFRSDTHVGTTSESVLTRRSHNFTNRIMFAGASRTSSRSSRARRDGGMRRRERGHRPEGGGTEQPTYSSAADAVAATAQVDGYKPREERSWEEFHPDLELDLKIPVFRAEAVDGIQPGDPKHTTDIGQPSFQTLPNGDIPAASPVNHVGPAPFGKRRPGRPSRRPESMLSGLGSPPAQRILPLPTQNPREKLSLPKPVFRDVDVFGAYEQDKSSQINYVNKTMEGLGYQKSDKFIRPVQTRLIRLAEKASDEDKESVRLEMDEEQQESANVRPLTQVEYDMDEQDQQWLDAYNAYRKEHESGETIKPAVFEVTMTQIEKEWHALERRIPKPNPKPPQTQRPRSSSAAAVNGELTGQGEEQDSRCAVCDDGDCENTNAIVFCDGCDLAVHQECYGVPYIPEGQWLCRKCQQVGRATPTCIFCPNTDGAFKMTTESKWVHLVCAIWIPEVSIANMSFMEPVTQVADVPKSRWKLVCYICNQRMGACIQCGNKNCFQAFHVTCARRAKLCLKMKSSHGGPAALDASVLKAYCDKHVPPEWRAEHDVEEATYKAKGFYRREMKGRRWADSQQSALTIGPSQQFASMEAIEDLNALDDTKAANATPSQKKKRMQAQKDIWRLPSGAPVVPQVLLNAVENSLQKFTIAKRKEFVAEACKYWSLKREARRGAALLKRLQLQMETFTTTELTRRDFAAMGAAGKPKLERRIQFAEQLAQEMSLVRDQCDKVMERERLKLQDAELLREAVDTVYFPAGVLLWPILEKARVLDQNFKFFTPALNGLQARLESRYYTSVMDFSTDFQAIFESVAGIQAVNGMVDGQGHSAGVSTRDLGLTPHQKEVLKLAKRILRTVQQQLQDAARRESELLQRPFDEELKALEMALDSKIQSLELPSPLIERNHEKIMSAADEHDNGFIEQSNAPDSLTSKDSNHHEASHQVETNGIEANSGDQNGVEERANSSREPSPTDDAKAPHTVGERTTRTSTPDQEDTLFAKEPPGGVPWYLEKFDIEGTTVYDERWGGRERAMSAQLSEMDEDELNGLDAEMRDATPKAERSPTTKKASAARKRKRRQFW